jgi:photosystem II stability/assembly factor-like uncharacterized protein
MRTWPVIYLVLSLSSLVAVSQESSLPTHHVSRVEPVQAPHRAISAVRGAVPEIAVHQPASANAGTASHRWQLLATLPNAIIHDISFSTATTGFAAGEHGQVWKTTNGGTTWVQILNSDTNDYFYGVDAVTPKDIVISGFYDSPTIQKGVFRWSHDGGSTWTGDLSFGATSLQRVRFVKGQDGLIMDEGGGNSPTHAEYTTDGGDAVSNWTGVEANADGGWFDPQFSFLVNSHARASGINFCTSLTGGSQWSCNPSVDSVFDGPVFFLNDSRGWVGGGEIYPSVEGWIHLTTNGGKTWTARTLDGPWPIRSILFLNNLIGWATGGNFYTGVGGIYFSTDGGKTWSVDATTGAEMGSCSLRVAEGKHLVWCAGFLGTSTNYSSVIYSTQY